MAGGECIKHDLPDPCGAAHNSITVSPSSAEIVS